MKRWTGSRKVEGRLSPEARGYDADWFKVRARHLRASPNCLMCLAQNILTKAQHVDHIISIRQRPDLRLVDANLQSLCQRHHDLITASIDSGDLRGACDVDGNPLDPRHPWSQTSPEAALATTNKPFKPSRDPAPERVAKLLKRQALGARR